MEDINLDDKFLIVIDKRKKTHLYPLNDNMVKALKVWLPKRESMMKKNNTEGNALFLSAQGTRIKTESVKMMLERYSKLALGYCITPHKLRAGYASILYDKTHDLEFVRRAVGHSDTSTTLRYIVTKGEERKRASLIMQDLL